MRGLKPVASASAAISSSRTLTSAWIETIRELKPLRAGKCRTLTSAWIETPTIPIGNGIEGVALSRVRGLKP